MSPTKGSQMQPMGRMPKMTGVYLGYVKDTRDVLRNGRLMVWVPEMGSSPDNKDGWIYANYCSPFAGATNLDTTNSTDTKLFDGTQTSYGMWMIPPDINNQVLIMFLNGDPSRGIWIGVLYNQFMNNMVPAVPSSDNNYQFHGKEVPVAEYNKNTPGITFPDQTIKPYHATKYKGVSNQGLIKDKRRGITTSSARREAPSQVFGILTPGPVIRKDVTPDKIRRKGGSSFVMDDAENSEYIQLATKSGAQININESNGFIYLINRDGSAWVQMDQKGNIDIFGAKNISMRAQRDFNIRADRNINIEAGQNIFMKAAKDTIEGTVPFTYDVNNVPKISNIPVWNIVGEGEGQGGNIVMQALNNWHSTTKKQAYLSVIDNGMDINIGNSLNVTTVNGGQEYNSKLGIKMSTNAALDVVSVGNMRVSANGVLSVVGSSGIIMCTNNDMSFNATGNIITTAGSAVSIDGTTLNIGTGVFIDGNIDANNATVNSISANTITAGKTTTSTIQSNTISYDKQTLNGNGSVTYSITPSLPVMLSPSVTESAMMAGTSKPAEVKPLNDKLNILATWADSHPLGTWEIFSTFKKYNKDDAVRHDDMFGNPIYYKSKINQGPSEFIPANWEILRLPVDSKFKRDSLHIRSTVSRFPTYEPCPEHETFSFASVGGSQINLTGDDQSFAGSGGPGGVATNTPPGTTNPGSNNTSVSGDSADDSVTSSSIPSDALKCQLMIHEGVKYKTYADSKGLPTGGIGHLLRANELALYPIGTPISTERVDTWYSQDVASAIKIAESLIGSTWGELSDIRKRAVIDLAYNMGKAGLSKFTNFLAYMKAKEFNKAGQELNESLWYKQVGRRGPNIIMMIVSSKDPNGCDTKFPT